MSSLKLKLGLSNGITVGKFGIPGGGVSDTTALTVTITTWQDNASLIHSGGLAEADWAYTTTMAQNVTMIAPQFGFRQEGYVRQIKYSCIGSGQAKTWKFKVFRWNNPTQYEPVAEQSFTDDGTTGVKTVTLSPIIAVQVGDVPGLFTPADSSVVRLKAGGITRYATGDITTANRLLSNVAYTLFLDCLTNRPYLAVTGDSIAEGHNQNTAHGILHTNTNLEVNPWRDTGEVALQLRSLLPVLEYQNLALGGDTYFGVAATGVPECQAVTPHTILIHAGVNDVSGARAWGEVEGNLDTIKAALTTEQLLIDEILPWSNGDDTQAATIRTFNANLATWCAANGATLIRCHDAMGQVRVSTGELDDLLAAYSFDGTHLSAAGVNALAAIWQAAL